MGNRTRALATAVTMPRELDMDMRDWLADAEAEAARGSR